MPTVGTDCSIGLLAHHCDQYQIRSNLTEEGLPCLQFKKAYSFVAGEAEWQEYQVALYIILTISLY